MEVTPMQVPRTIWKLHIDNTELKRLFGEHNPMFSPGQHIYGEATQ